MTIGTPMIILWPKIVIHFLCYKPKVRDRSTNSTKSHLFILVLSSFCEKKSIFKNRRKRIRAVISLRGIICHWGRESVGRRTRTKYLQL